jgi:hypothetical protein
LRWRFLCDLRRDLEVRRRKQQVDCCAGREDRPDSHHRTYDDGPLPLKRAHFFESLFKS